MLIQISTQMVGGYGIVSDTGGYHSLPDGSIGKNVIIFGVDMGSSVHIDNKAKDILMLGKGPTQGLNHTFTAEAKILLILQDQV